MKLIPNMFAKTPRVAEHDFAGEVVDANGTEYSSGDQVFGFIPTGMLLNFFFFVKDDLLRMNFQI